MDGWLTRYNGVIMTTPDPQLSQIYGTTKEASDMGIAARIAAAVLSMGLASADKERRSEDKSERDKKTEEKRRDEADRMRAAIEALKTAGANAGQTLARDFEKQAFGALMGKAVGALATGAGRAVGAVPGGRSLVGALTPSFKTKAIGTAGTLAAGYAGYKGLSALRNYASTEPGDMNWGAKRGLKHNVNEWGVPSA